MGQKVHPISFRLGAIRDWNSRWFATKNEIPKFINEDYQIRKLIHKEITTGLVSRVEIERASKHIRIQIYAGRPGMIIGRQGAQIETLKSAIGKIVGDGYKISIDIIEVKEPQLDAQILADNIAFQLVKRSPFRRTMKKTVQSVKDAGGEGIRIRCSGRLGGAEIARVETMKYGKVPLQTIRANIDYGFSEARTTYGIIGIKVWVYKGDKFTRDVKRTVVSTGKKNVKE
ncbi:30S ribosomal protein S3 [Candidatus Omnitrophus magneticus]|uniref:Small ribosomal subunit protein uS3 n=1 Tax=Candidatus Omnitrophus magneticus TaxID=1609969 RepID=A0A0F0CSB0_9BACT|nr:30S ribosomal protein S3 [Candidatus Omnitrophus magneticus]